MQYNSLVLPTPSGRDTAHICGKYPLPFLYTLYSHLFQEEAVSSPDQTETLHRLHNYPSLYSASVYSNGQEEEWQKKTRYYSLYPEIPEDFQPDLRRTNAPQNIHFEEVPNKSHNFHPAGHAC